MEAFDPLLDVQTVFTVQQAALERGAADEPPAVDLTNRMREVEDALGIPLGQVVTLPLLFEEELLGIIYLFRGDYALPRSTGSSCRASRIRPPLPYVTPASTRCWKPNAAGSQPSSKTARTAS